MLGAGTWGTGAYGLGLGIEFMVNTLEGELSSRVVPACEINKSKRSQVRPPVWKTFFMVDPWYLRFSFAKGGPELGAEVRDHWGFRLLWLSLP